MLVSLTSIFLTDSLDVASMKEQMEAYAKFMAQLQTQAKGREIREPLTQEPWFNLIWDRQKKRGVIT
jgi:Ser/Thr protein kinase RdoA (MazF antagonist)